MAWVGHGHLCTLSASSEWVSLHPCPCPARSLARSVVGWVRLCPHLLYYMSLLASYVVAWVVVRVFAWVCVLFGRSWASVVVLCGLCSIFCVSFAVGLSGSAVGESLESVRICHFLQSFPFL